MVYCMTDHDLTTWVRTKAKHGDIAYWYDKIIDQHYYYVYKGPDDKPYWRLIDNSFYKFLQEKEECDMDKRCDSCKHFSSVNISEGGWCNHKKHKGMYVPKFTSCPEYEPTETQRAPFAGMKFYLKDNVTLEMEVKYICEDCGKEMVKPYRWWFALPAVFNGKLSKNPGYHFRCKECNDKIGGKV